MAKKKISAPPLPTWMFITPKMAALWLKERAENRVISVTSVEGFCRILKAGEFKVTHQGIAFRDSDGQLIDGQHRLAAIVQTGIGIWSWVFRGVPDQSIIAMDTGKPRSVGAILEIGHSVTDGGRVRAVATMLHYIHTGMYATLTAQEVLAVYNSAAPAFEWNAGYSAYTSVGGAAVAAACIFAYPGDPDGITIFRNSLNTGADLSAGSPILALRNNLRNHPPRTGGARVGVTRLTLTAIVKWLENKPVKLLRTGELSDLRAAFEQHWQDAYGAWPVDNSVVIRTSLMERIETVAGER